MFRLQEARSGIEMRKWLAVLLIFAGLTVVVLNFAEVENFAFLLERAQPLWLLAAVVFQVSTYVSVAACWSVVLRASGSPRPLGTLVPLSVAKLFADQAVPTAGISGNIVLVDRLIAVGVPRGHAVSALVFSIIGYYAAYATLAVTMLVLLWLHNEATVLLAGVVSVFLLLALAVALGTVWLVHRGDRIPDRLRRIAVIGKTADLLAEAPADLLRNRPLILKAALLNALVFLADAATLWVVLAAVGDPVRFSTAFIPFIMASIAATLGPTPMGLGSFEAVCIGMLRLLHVPLEAAVAATLLLRGFTLWLPMLPGMMIARRMVRLAGAHRLPTNPQ